jgi:hypothetical protein
MSIAAEQAEAIARIAQRKKLAKVRDRMRHTSMVRNLVKEGIAREANLNIQRSK